MNQLLQIPCEISKVESMGTNQVRMKVDTQEISAEDAANVMRLKGKFGWMVFREGTAVKEADIDLPEIKREEDTKSPAQRMRAVIYLIWSEKGKHGDFEQYYRQIMESMIGQLKEKLT